MSVTRSVHSQEPAGSSSCRNTDTDDPTDIVGGHFDPIARSSPATPPWEQAKARRSKQDRRAIGACQQPSGIARKPVARVTAPMTVRDRKSTRLNSSHVKISYAVFCLKKKKNNERHKSSYNSTSGLMERR